MIELEDLIGLNYYLELTEEFRDLVKDEIYKKYGSLRQFGIRSKLMSQPSIN